MPSDERHRSTRTAIRNDLQRPLTSGIGVQGPRDLKRDFRERCGKVILVERHRPNAYVLVQVCNIRLTPSHEEGDLCGLSLGNWRCWTTSVFRGVFDISSSWYFRTVQLTVKFDSITARTSCVEWQELGRILTLLQNYWLIRSHLPTSALTLCEGLRQSVVSLWLLNPHPFPVALTSILT